MDFAYFSSFIDKLFNYVHKESDMGERERIFVRATKMSEEVGEVCAAIMTRYKFSPQSKIDIYKEEDLANEIADVVITAALLSKAAGIDLETAILRKVEKTKVRFNLD